MTSAASRLPRSLTATSSQFRHTVAVTLLCVLTSAIFFCASLRFHGPAYLGDEIGYLSNAAFLGGHPSDGASSYYAGYSLLLAPIFWLASGAEQVWTGVLALNALMWGTTLFLVSSVLQRLIAGVPSWRHLLALAVVACYPAYLAMSGYAFSQSAFALCFTLAVATLATLSVERWRSMCLHGVFVGYLCCIHPSGLPVAVASLAIMAALAWRARRWLGFVAGSAIILSMALGYHLVLHPALVARMSSDAVQAVEHYPGFGQLLAPDKLLEHLALTVTIAVGQLSYVLIATFGFAGLGLAAIFRSGIAAWHTPNEGQSDIQRAAVGALILLSVLGVIAETSISSAAGGGPNRIDQWIYGRYLEPMIALLLGLGLLSPSRRAWTAVVALFTVLVGAYLVHVKQIGGALYVMNVPALWPQALGWGKDVLSWFLFGAAGMVVAAVLYRPLVMLVILGLYVACAPTQQHWHSLLLQQNSNPSAITEFVEQNYRPGQCVGFDVVSSATREVPFQQRANLYSFYFYDSPLRRVTPAQWFARCEGPLLTFNSSLKFPGTRYLGRENFSKLYVLVKDAPQALRLPTSQPEEQVWTREGDDVACMLAGCFEKKGAGFAGHTLVGAVSDAGISTDGRPGYLSFGPYVYMSEGSYFLQMEGDFEQVGGVWVDVVSGAELTVHTDVPLANFLTEDRRLARIPFELPRDSRRLQVRVRVTAADKMLLRGYNVVVNKTAIRSAGELGLGFQDSQALSQLPRQVGRVTGRGLGTDGRTGFLLFGPYRALPAGRYQLNLKGDVTVARAAWVDVVSHQGQSLHTSQPIRTGMTGDLANLMFDLPTDVKDLEVRVYVGERDQLEVTAYTIGKLQ